jgi:peptide/nickel transport system substrate-binding protein
MFRRRKKVGLAGVAAAGAAALLAAGCSSAGAPASSSSGGTPVSGGTATIAMQAGVTDNWIFPFYSITNSSVYVDQQFQWLMYRPLYMFGNNTGSSVSINYSLSPADAPVYSNGGKTVTVTMKGWKFSDGESVDAQSVVFFLNMAEAEKANWYA